MGDMRVGMKVGVGEDKASSVWATATPLVAAMKEGNITKVHHVDSETFSVLGVYARYKTIVYGE